MPTALPGSTTSIAASTSAQQMVLSGKAAKASRLQIVNNSTGLIFVRVTTSAENAAATVADIPIVVTQNNPYVLDKKPGDDVLSILGTVASGTVYATGMDGFQ
jgi:hypothetical protein